MPQSTKAEAYKRVEMSLRELDNEDTEIIIQTLPPFPWYFGGQLFLNLFVDSKETFEFCQEYNRRICFDTSHSQLACNRDKTGFIESVSLLSPYIKHMHVADAHGMDQEGVQLGHGDVDFEKLFKVINVDTTFIPEIWQGHRNFGEECWKALEYIEKILKVERC